MHRPFMPLRLAEQPWQANEVVGRGLTREGHVDALAASHPDTAQEPKLLAPPESLLDPLADALAERVAGMARRASVKGGASPCCVAGNVRRDVHGAQLVHKILGVIALVAPEQNAVRSVDRLPIMARAAVRSA